jgi:DNA-binding MarR family transcriptional regulator
MAQFRLLHFIQREPTRSLSDLADDLGISSPAASKMVDLLVERGLVERAGVEGDRRRIALALTRGGRDLMRQARQALEARVGERLSGLPAAEAAGLAKALYTLRLRLDSPEGV